MTPMTSRQRVLAAFNHQPPNRVPIDIGGSSVSTLIGHAYERLKTHLGITEETQYMKRKSRSVILPKQ
jgi:uroporphyrinogen decarboxylase